ncbi:MAG: PocR ligand-binding domain-containing protein [Acetivibrionales bacterium]
MLQNRERDDNGFDLGKAIICADTYSSSVGVDCTIMDLHGKTMYKSCGSSNGCRFCEAIRGVLQEKQSCVNAHLYGSYQAERFGGKYVFFCPFGLVHWVSPITVDGIMKASILAGPVQMVEPDEFLLEDIIQKNNISKKQMNSIRKYIDEIPVIKPEKVNSLSEMLYIVAEHISNILPSQYQEGRESQEQQANISEYIHYIKTMGGDDSNLHSYPLEKKGNSCRLYQLAIRLVHRKY